jgi:uncharacterized protein YbjT (DUF2867 family)
MRELGVEATVGSFEDGASLRQALVGVARLFLLAPPGVDAMVRQQRRVLQAAMEAGGVTHIVKVSSIAADEPTDASIVVAHRSVEEEIERSGIGWTHLRPNWYMQNEVGQAEAVGRGGTFFAPDITQVSMIDARDVAEVAARVLTEHGHAGRAYTLTGPQPIGYAEIAEVYSRIVGRTVRWEPVTLEQARAAMPAGGLPEVLATGFCEIMRGYRRGGSTRAVSPAVHQLTGRVPRSFDRFVTDHRAIYLAANSAVSATR